MGSRVVFYCAAVVCSSFFRNKLLAEISPRPLRNELESFNGFGPAYNPQPPPPYLFTSHAAAANEWMNEWRRQTMNEWPNRWMKRPDVTLLAVGARAFDGCRSGWLIEDAVDESSLQGQQLSRDWRCCLFIVLVPQLSHSVSLLFSCTKKRINTHTRPRARKKKYYLQVRLGPEVLLFCAFILWHVFVYVKSTAHFGCYFLNFTWKLNYTKDYTFLLDVGSVNVFGNRNCFKLFWIVKQIQLFATGFYTWQFSFNVISNFEREFYRYKCMNNKIFCPQLFSFEKWI